MATILTAHTITNIGALFELYEQQFPHVSEEAFYRFLLAPTPEREIFLEQYCSKTYIEQESQVIEVILSI